MTKWVLAAVTVFAICAANFAHAQTSERPSGYVVILSTHGQEQARFEIADAGIPPKLQTAAHYFISLKSNAQGEQSVEIRFTDPDARVSLDHLFSIKDQLEYSEEPLTIFHVSARSNGESIHTTLSQVRIGTDAGEAVAGPIYVSQHAPLNYADHAYLDFTGGSPVMRQYVPGE